MNMNKIVGVVLMILGTIIMLSSLLIPKITDGLVTQSMIGVVFGFLLIISEDIDEIKERLKQND